MPPRRAFLDELIARGLKTPEFVIVDGAPRCAEMAAMLFWALPASGQIVMRKVDGWETLAQKPSNPIIDLAA